ncbi:MAG: tetratricopeptide repeat protein [Sandaracinaceae bacterium]|nr:tetratricopeptide repeat protein [Sandaracinaceae bacterium]
MTRLENATRALAALPVRHDNLQSPTHVEERLTDGELFYRLQDYIRASIIFTDIVDNYPRHTAYPDALFLLADSLFRAGDQLGARTRFRQLIDRADEQQFRPYAQRALGRLIEIAIHTRDFDGVEGYFARLSRLPPGEVEAATAYFRAKYLYNRAVPTDEIMRETRADAPVPQIDQTMLDEARTAFEAVQERSPYYPQSRYFVGVIYTLKQQYPQAIDAFRRVLRAPATTPEHQQVADLTHLSLGRLYYETDQLEQATEAYQDVPRTSSMFDIALYEIAWVYIRMGDSTRAERALEVLTVAAPESRFIPDGKILRGNLLLRNGRFDDATTVFREVTRQFGPVRRELDEMVSSHDNPREYFQGLVRDNMATFDANAFLPPLATQWARAEGDMDRALSILSDLSQSRTLVRETSDLIERLNALLLGSNRVSAYPDLREQRETSVSVRNQLARLRQQLMTAEGEDVPETGELAEVRSRRRQLEEFLGAMPTTAGDFSVRNERLLGRYRVMERDLRNLQVDLMGMQARIVATDRYLSDTAAQRSADTTQGAEALQSELANQRQAVIQYGEQIDVLRHMLERARMQVGVGDARYQRDENVREEYQQLVAREHALILATGSATARQVAPLFARVDAIETQLNAKDANIDSVVEERTAALRTQIQQESRNVEGYRTQIAELEGETVEVVGGVTFANFSRVRQRFYDLVLRADVGRIDVAWAVREEHRSRVENLTRERAREMRALDDEFREIMDDSGNAAPGGAH